MLALALAAIIVPAACLAEDEEPESAPSETSGAATPSEPLAAAEHPALTVANKAFDAVVLRPVGFATTAVGAVLFVPAAALASPGGRDAIDQALERFILTPWEYTAMRPLGEF